MKRAYFAWMIILWIGCFSFFAINTSALENRSSVILSQSSSDGPTIDWPYSEEGNVIAWDGIYNGQTEEVWKYETWVNDSDNVDCVLFRYRWYSQSEWINRTTTLIEGNDTKGLYSGNFTYDVWWNWESGYPGTEGDGGNFFFKIFANDSLGNWNETVSIQYTGGYYVVCSPEPTVTDTSTTNPEEPDLTMLMINVAIIGSAIVIIIVAIWTIRKNR